MEIELQTSLNDAFKTLATAMLKFELQLRNSKLPLWLPLTEAEISAGLSMKDKALALYTDLWHQGEGDGRVTINCHGLIGANSKLIESAEQLNHAKLRFKQLVGSLKIKNPSVVNQLLRRRSRALSQRLQRAGLARLHLKHCYRQVPILSAGCASVQFSWYSSGRSIKRISHQHSLDKLLKLNQSSEHVHIQIKKLSNLRPATRLAQVQTQVPVMRANAAWPIERANEPKKWLRKARNAPLPLLIHLEDNQVLPSFNQPDTQPPAERQRALRSDSVIETEPLLPSLRIHCYRE